jgi:DNA-binding NtrC family response regulator
MDRLADYDWPGNVRELQSVVNRFAISGKPEVFWEHISLSGNGFKPDASKKIQETEARLICTTLSETKWNRRRAADVLGISYSTLRRKIEKYGIDIDEGRNPSGANSFSQPLTAADKIPQRAV